MAQPRPGSADTATEDDWECDASEGDIGEVLASHHRPAAVASPVPRDKEFEISAAELTLDESVGAGCTAEVFKAYWRGKVVAAKVMRDSSDIGHRERVAFHRELNVLAKASHPNLVRLFCVCFRARPWRIVTEFCPGGDVFQLLHVDSVDLTWGQRIKMLTDVAAGMEYLHWFPPPIIHRDLKSLNLLLTEAVRSPEDPVTVKVSDFGLARARPTDSVRCRMTPCAGTLNWMAPEVLMGHYYDEKADVYSYGMVLFELISSEVPFEDEDEIQIRRLVSEGVRPDLEAIPPGCPKFLPDVMMSCWAHLASQRPSFAHVLRILQAAAAALAARPQPGGARGAGAGGPARPASPRP